MDGANLLAAFAATAAAATTAAAAATFWAGVLRGLVGGKEDGEGGAKIAVLFFGRLLPRGGLSGATAVKSAFLDVGRTCPGSFNGAMRVMRRTLPETILVCCIFFRSIL